MSPPVLNLTESVKVGRVMAGEPSRPLSPSPTSLSDKRRTGEEALGTEESLSRGSAMETTRPGRGSEAAASAVPAPSPPTAPSAVVPPGDGSSNPVAEGDVTPIPRLPESRLLLPPRPRPPMGPRAWAPPKSVGELPDCKLKDVYLIIPEPRRTDVWYRRTRRYPNQVTLPDGVVCDLPALLCLADAPEVQALSTSLAMGSGDVEIDDTHAVVSTEWCALPRPYLGGEDAHAQHGVVREEFRLRGSSGFLIHGSRVEFTHVPLEEREHQYPFLPGWWETVEVPCGFPARIPLLVAYFGSVLRSSSEGNRVFAYLATHWVVVVARGWYSDVVHRGYLWHLPPALVEGMETLGFHWLALGAGDLAPFLLKGMVTLHNRLDWAQLDPFLRRNKRPEPGLESEPPREFVHVTHTLVQGQLLLREGLGDSSLPYAEGVTPSTSPPGSGWATSSATTRRGAHRGAPRSRGRAVPTTSPRVATPTSGGVEPNQAPPFQFLEPFPDVALGSLRVRTPVPMPIARGVGEMLPNLGAIMYDATVEASLVASLDTLAWVTRRVSHFLASGDSATARQSLAAEVTRLAVGHEFVQRLLSTQQQLPRHGGSTSGHLSYDGDGSASRRAPPSASTPGPSRVGYAPPLPAYDPGGSWSGGPYSSGGGRMER